MRLLNPSFNAGFARGPSECLHPELWKGLVLAMAPAMGVQGLRTLIDFSPYRRHTSWASNGTWATDEPGWSLDSGGASLGIIPGIVTQFLDFGIFVRFRPISATALFGRIVDKSYSGGTWLGVGSVSTSTWGGGVKESSAPYGRYVTLGTTGWHTLASTRMGTTHLVVGDAEVETSGTVSGTALDTNTLTILTGGPEIFSGRISEIFIWDRALARGEIDLLHRCPLAPFIVRRRRDRVTFYIPPITANASLSGADGTISGDTTVFATITIDGAIPGGTGTITGSTTVVATITADATIAGADGTISGAAQVGLIIIQGGDGTIAGLTTVYTSSGLPNGVPPPLLLHKRPVMARNAALMFESGRRRVRRQYTEALELWDVVWHLTQDKYEIFEEWFQTLLTNGEKEFILITLEASEIPGQVRQWTRTLAFMTPNYAMSHSDNLFAVTVTLELLIDQSYVNIDNPALPPVPAEEFSDNPLITYPDPVCRDTFTAILENLKLKTVYAMQAGNSTEGPWEEHIFFKLQTTEEKTTLRKVVYVNNDYGGATAFRVIRVTDKKLVRKAQFALASAIPAPDVTIDEVTNITETVPPPWNTTLLPLRGIYDMPLSQLEVPTLISGLYVRIQKKYAGYFVTADDFAALDGNTTRTEQVTATGAFGTTSTWTRDGSNPEVDTVIENYEGQIGNAAIHRADFKGQIRARSFGFGCQSPLAIVAVDKLVFERNKILVSLAGTTVAGSCDLTRLVQKFGYQERGDDHHVAWGPLMTPDGTPILEQVESGQSCNDFFGSPATFEQFMRSSAQAGSGAMSGPEDTPLIFDVESTTEEVVDYLGWTNHRVKASGFSATSAAWERNPDKWNAYPKIFNWLIVGSEFSLPGFARFPILATLAGEGGNALEFNNAISSAVVGSPDAKTATRLRPGADSAGIYHLTTALVALSIVPWSEKNPRDDYWSASPADAADPGDIPAPPPPEDRETVEDWEAYAEGEYVTGLGAGHGFAVGSEWKVITLEKTDGTAKIRFRLGSEGIKPSPSISNPTAPSALIQTYPYATDNFMLKHSVAIVSHFAMLGGDDGWATISIFLYRALVGFDQTIPFHPVAIYADVYLTGPYWQPNNFDSVWEAFDFYPVGPVIAYFDGNALPEGFVFDPSLPGGGQGFLRTGLVFVPWNPPLPNQGRGWTLQDWTSTDLAGSNQGAETFEPESDWGLGTLIDGVHSVNTGSGLQPTGWKIISLSSIE